MAEPQKDTIYVDIDDEITGIIDKVGSSKAKIVALVLPKRATVFQSIVNMKLLKRRADSVNKHLVLITTEAGLLPLAGAVGLHVAKTPSSKPEIPAGPVMEDDLPEEVAEPETDDEPDFDPDASAGKTLGELSGVAAAEDSIEIDNSSPVAEAPEAEVAPPEKSKKGKDKKLRVPNFSRFRLGLILGILILILLIGGYIVGFKVLPRATIDVKTNAADINNSIDMTLDTNATKLDPTGQAVPAQTESQQKTYTGQADATGKQNQGTAATGSVTMTTQTCAPNLFPGPSSVPAGTGVSSNSLTYITQETASFSMQNGGNGSCINWQSNNIDIVAQQPGSQYNDNNTTTSFSVNGRPDVTASGSADGGSDNIVTVVQQSDIDKAKKQLDSQNAAAIKQQLAQSLTQAGLKPIAETFTTNDSNVKTSAKAGDQADSVTVTEDVTYTMFGVKESDLEQLVKYSVDQQINTSKQVMLDAGLANASFSMSQKPSSTKAQVVLQATAIAGPDLNKATIAKQAAGKKVGDIKNMIENNPGVTGVEVHYSPFWVTSTPSSPSKITVIFEKPVKH